MCRGFWYYFSFLNSKHIFYLYRIDTDEIFFKKIVTIHVKFGTCRKKSVDNEK